MKYVIIIEVHLLVIYIFQIQYTLFVCIVTYGFLFVSVVFGKSYTALQYCSFKIICSGLTALLREGFIFHCVCQSLSSRTPSHKYFTLEIPSETGDLTHNRLQKNRLNSKNIYNVIIVDSFMFLSLRVPLWSYCTVVYRFLPTLGVSDLPCTE